MANIAVVIGSPRSGGNTDMLASEFIRGAKENNDVTVIYAARERIHPCLGCNYCYKSEGNRCAQDDAMTEIYKKLSKADVIVIATPVYFYGVSAQLKALIDRLHNPIRNNFRVKELVLLSVAADDIATVFDSMLTMYVSVLEYFSLEDGGIITASGVKDKGDIAGNAALERAYLLGKGYYKGRELGRKNDG